MTVDELRAIHDELGLGVKLFARAIGMTGNSGTVGRKLRRIMISEQDVPHGIANGAHAALRLHRKKEKNHGPQTEDRTGGAELLRDPAVES